MLVIPVQNGIQYLSPRFLGGTRNDIATHPPVGRITSINAPPLVGGKSPATPLPWWEGIKGRGKNFFQKSNGLLAPLMGRRT
jgi:hypothetical protein